MKRMMETLERRTLLSAVLARNSNLVYATIDSIPVTLASSLDSAPLKAGSALSAIASPANQLNETLTRTVGLRILSTNMSIRRVDSSDPIDPTLRTCVVIHGRDNSPTTAEIAALCVGVKATQAVSQVLVVDWSDAASATWWQTSDGEGWIEPVGASAARILRNYGFTGGQLNLIGHSWGSYVADELAEGFVNVNTIVALDPAINTIGSPYNINDRGVINFSAHSNYSIAFRSSPLGSDSTPTSADETYVVNIPGDPVTQHDRVRQIFTYMLTHKSGGVSRHFQYSRVISATPEYWQLDQYNPTGAVTGQYDGVITAKSTGLAPDSVMYVDPAGKSKRDLEDGSPSIAVTWSTVPITDGSAQPVTTNGTNLGDAFLGRTGPTRKITVQNTGTVTLKVGSVSVPPRFELIEGLTTNLSPGSSDTFTVRLMTAELGLVTGQVSFSTNAAGKNPFNFTVMGNVKNAPATIGGVVYDDQDGSGTRSSSELGLANQIVYLDANKDGSLGPGELQTTTNQTGIFKFSGLEPGTYRVRELIASGYRMTSPSARFYDVTLVSGQSVGSRSFGITRLGLISGSVFNDINGDKIRQSTETGLGNWRVFVDLHDAGIFDAGEPSSLTDSSGKFTLNSNAGNRNIRVVVPSGWNQTYPNEYSANSVVLGSGQTIANVNFGVAKIAIAPTPNIVSVDPNPVIASDVNQTLTVFGSNFVAGSILRLTNTTGGTSVDKTPTSLGSGQLSVSMIFAPGRWQLQVINPGNIPSSNFNLVVQAPAPRASVSGKVWNDTNRNLSVDSGEGGIGGRIVYLDGNNNGAPDGSERTTITGSDGSYSFGELAAGTYHIRQVLPSNWEQTSPSGGFGQTVVLSSSQSVTGKNFGAVLAVPAPSISSISPGTIVGSNSDQNITIHGANFISGSVVRFTNLTNGQVVNETPVSYNANSIIVLCNFTVTQADWTAQVIAGSLESNILRFTVHEPSAVPEIIDVKTSYSSQAQLDGETGVESYTIDVNGYLTVRTPTKGTVDNYAVGSWRKLIVADFDGEPGEEFAFLSNTSQFATIVTQRTKTRQFVNIGAWTTVAAVSLDANPGYEILVTQQENATVASIRNGTVDRYAIGTHTTLAVLNLDGAPGDEILTSRAGSVTITTHALKRTDSYSVDPWQTFSATHDMDGSPGLEIVMTNQSRTTIITQADRRLDSYATGPWSTMVLRDVDGELGDEVVMGRQGQVVITIPRTRSMDVYGVGSWSSLSLADRDNQPGDEILLNRPGFLTVVTPRTRTIQLIAL